MTEKEINKLVSDNINYVKSVANHYRGNGVDFDDLVSEGTLAMLTAAQKYDAERGSQFVAYASPFIRKAMQQTIDKQAALYRVPKDQKKHAPRNAAKAVSIDAPITEGNKYTLLDILINKRSEDQQGCPAGRRQYGFHPDDQRLGALRWRTGRMRPHSHL